MKWGVCTLTSFRCLPKCHLLDLIESSILHSWSLLFWLFSKERINCTLFTCLYLWPLLTGSPWDGYLVLCTAVFPGSKSVCYIIGCCKYLLCFYSMVYFKAWHCLYLSKQSHGFIKCWLFQSMSCDWQTLWTSKNKIKTVCFWNKVSRD